MSAGALRNLLALGSLLVLLQLAGAGVASAAPAPVPHSVAAEAAGTQAKLTWSEPPEGGPASSIELTIHQAAPAPGASLTTPVRSSDCSPCGIETPPGGSPLSVTDLEGEGRAAILVRLTTGGAHCCTVVQFHVTSPTMTGTYTTLEKNFGDPGMTIGPPGPDGHVELISADDRFAYAFAPYAYSGLPLQIWELRQLRLVDVTRRFKASIAADGAHQWRAFRTLRRGRFALGFAAAWAADEALLGRRGIAFAKLRREARAGHLRSGRLPGEAGGMRFIARLRHFLAANGY